MPPLRLRVFTTSLGMMALELSKKLQGAGVWSLLMEARHEPADIKRALSMRLGRVIALNQLYIVIAKYVH